VTKTLILMCVAGAMALVRPCGAAAPDSSGAYPNEEAIHRYAAGRLLEESGEASDALGEYYRAFALDPRAVSVAARISEVAAQLGDPSRSLEFADRALALDPNQARLHWLRGAALFNLGRSTEALAALTRAVEADSEQAEYHRTLARVADAIGRIDLVERSYRRATEIDPDDGESWFQLAAIRARLGRFDEADEALTLASDLSPMRPGTLFMRGFIREGQGRYPEAIDCYRHHLEIHQADLVTRRRLVQLLARTKRYPEAYHEAQIVSHAQPDDIVSLEVLADLAYRSHQAAQGDRIAKDLEARASSNPDQVLRLVGLLARNNRKKEALAVADRWAKTAPPPRGDMLAAQALAITGDPQGATARGRIALATAPDSLEPRLLLARLLQSQKRYAAAESAWAQGLERGADTLSVMLEIAFCREQLGDLAGAERAVRDVLRGSPSEARALNFLGYMLADHNLELDEALAMIRRALELDPDNGAYVDSLGWVYYRLGRLESARTELERALKLTGGDPVIYEHLGDVYRDLKLFTMARQQYRLSLSLDQKNPKLKAKLAEIQ